MERRAEAEQEILDLINRSKWQEVASKCEEWEYLVRFFSFRFSKHLPINVIPFPTQKTKVR